MDLPNIDAASQLEGSKEGHIINTEAVAPAKAVETAVENLVEDVAKSDLAAFLKEKGFPTTLLGAVQYGVSVVQGVIPSTNATVDADLKAVLATALAAAEPYIPAINL